MAIKDDTIAELRKLVAKQSEQITALTALMKRLNTKLTNGKSINWN